MPSFSRSFSRSTRGTFSPSPLPVLLGIGVMLVILSCLPFTLGQLPSTCTGSTPMDCRTQCPCQFNSTCRPPDYTTCACDMARSTGKYCEVPICNRPLGCGPGKCVSPEVCDCTGTGFSGKYCTTPVCTSPCKNGGKCVAPNRCDCSGTGYSGAVCDAPICNAPIGCGPGTCVASETCSCDAGWTGKYCTTPICDPPCANGKCFGPNACDCTSTGFTGTLCETPECNPLCEHGSTCSAPGVCDCSTAGPGWSGQRCEIADCSPNTCQNQGVCSAPGECNCANTGFYGLACEIDEDECSRSVSPCYTGFQCSNSQGSYSCVGTCPTGLEGSGKLEENGGCHTPTDCPRGYDGSLAAGCFDINECTSSYNPCNPASGCVNTIGGYNCTTCTDGYAGTPCVDVNECTTLTKACDPLTNCTNTLGSFDCTPCPTGYTGTGKTACVLIGTTSSGQQSPSASPSGVIPVPTGQTSSTSSREVPTATPTPDPTHSAATSSYSVWLLTFLVATQMIFLLM